MFKLDNFGVVLFVSFSYKKLLQYSFYENWKNRCKNRFFLKKFKKVCVLQRRACALIQNFKRNYLENYNDSEHAVKTKNAPFFIIFPNISFFPCDCNLLDWSFKGHIWIFLYKTWNVVCLFRLSIRIRPKLQYRYNTLERGGYRAEQLEK